MVLADILLRRLGPVHDEAFTYIQYLLDLVFAEALFKIQISDFLA